MNYYTGVKESYLEKQRRPMWFGKWERNIVYFVATILIPLALVLWVIEQPIKLIKGVIK